MFGFSMNKCALLALAAGFSSSVLAQDTVPQHIDVTGFGPDQAGSKVIEDVVVPVPSEIFAVLDKQGKPAWSEVLHPVKDVAIPGSSAEQISLLLGTVIAEGFVAVEAENTEEVKNIGRTVLTLSKALGVENAVKRRSNAIIQMAEKKDWRAVRKELDGALADVKKAMDEMKSQDRAQLVSLGGWLRGTQALTTVVEKNFSKDGAELLHQPALLNHFKRMIDRMDARKKNALVNKIRQGLNEIGPLMSPGDGGEVTEKTVKEIERIATDLIKAINQKQSLN
jgi:hypothetical protein